MLKIHQNTKEGLEHIVSMCTECMRVFMACMLMMFVQQTCGKDEPTCERLHIMDNGHRFSLLINFISLINFIILYISETQRQFFLIKKFDVDKSLPDDNLKNVLETEPELNSQLEKINSRHIKIVFTNCVVYIVNVLTSSYVIIKYYYGGLESIAGIISNVLLVSSKLYDDIVIMSSDMKGLSTSIQEPLSYNSLEKICLDVT